MTYEFLVASAIGVLVAGGTYLCLRARTFAVVLGLTLLSYAVNLCLFASGPYADPLPQALVLTAIVITFGMTAFVVVLALRSFLETGSDHVDGDKVACDAQDGLMKDEPSRDGES